MPRSHAMKISKWNHYSMSVVLSETGNSNVCIS